MASAVILFFMSAFLFSERMIPNAQKIKQGKLTQSSIMIRFISGSRSFLLNHIPIKQAIFIPVFFKPFNKLAGSIPQNDVIYTKIPGL
jgi:hypothetical protein